MTGNVCPQCGGVLESRDDSCASRFDMLLALDHSRQEPWGSRHGSAFAAFALQHPAGRSRETLDRCWTLLYRIWVANEDPQAVARSLRRVPSGGLPHSPVPSRRGDASTPTSFRFTIVDLGAFEADAYPRRLEEWCRATLDAFGSSGGA